MSVLISHSRGSQLAEKLSAALRTRGLSPWLAEVDTPAGSNWQGAIETALQRAQAVVFLMEPGLKPGPWQQHEWSAALEASWNRPSLRLIPLVVEGAELPLFLHDRSALRVGRRGQNWERVAAQIEKVLQENRVPRLSKKASREDRLRWHNRLVELKDQAYALNAGLESLKK